ncbi:hypothetical protein KP509_27G023300 [Ceratopteris richardii]|uniref:Uncharacterized protein n=1 Tax=Ceratopteris richardii TaxID=49495 RepID=A0A8T2RG06_CERRI|nr:hypothetical protein KP509_27G023300 [Ceratopteris richardii]
MDTLALLQEWQSWSWPLGSSSLSSGLLLFGAVQILILLIILLLFSSSDTNTSSAAIRSGESGSVLPALSQSSTQFTVRSRLLSLASHDPFAPTLLLSSSLSSPTVYLSPFS